MVIPEKLLVQLDVADSVVNDHIYGLLVGLCAHLVLLPVDVVLDAADGVHGEVGRVEQAPNLIH